MKKEVILPQLPEAIDSDERPFYTEILEELRDIRRDTVEAINENLIKEIDDADYTLQEKYYNKFKFVSLTADRDFNLPSLVGYEGYEFEIINLSDYSVVVTPDGTDDINDWNETFEITEAYGRVKILALSDRWLATPLNDACIYEVSSETADTGLALDGTWDDVVAMTLLNGIYGKGYLYAFTSQVIQDTSIPSNMYGEFGIGKTLGNNAPDIKSNRRLGFGLNSQDCDYITGERSISEFEYESDGSIIYMKSKAYSNELNVTGHTCYGDTDCPMFIKFVRKY